MVLGTESIIERSGKKYGEGLGKGGKEEKRELLQVNDKLQRNRFDDCLCQKWIQINEDGKDWIKKNGTELIW